MSPRAVEWSQAGSVELKVDCYDGLDCDEHRPYWSMDVDKEGPTEMPDPLLLRVEHWPPGTRVEITVPLCPECNTESGDCACGFDWKSWREERYS